MADMLGAPLPSTSSPSVSLSLLQSLPKTDLHCHLDGSLRTTTLLELAATHGVELPATDVEGIERVIHKGEICGDLVEYLRAFDVTCAVLQTEDALERAAFELAEDAARENVWHLEIRYAPTLHTRRGLSLARIVEAVLRGLARAERRYPITTGVILCGIRNMEPRQSYRLAELAVAYKNRGVVAFDLAGGEFGNPARRHAESFALVLDNNMNTTVHAGEAYGPGSIKQALHYCGAHRIGHGTRLAEDGDLLAYVIDRRVPLEVCLSSNLQTSTIDALAHHPLRLFFDLGVRVSVNTDNRLITDTTVTKELWLAHQHLGFNLEELKVLIIQGFKSAFLPYRQKREMLERANDAIKDITGSLPYSALLSPRSGHPSLTAEPVSPGDASGDTDRI